VLSGQPFIIWKPTHAVHAIFNLGKVSKSKLRQQTE
jgi:hypothetical protein